MNILKSSPLLLAALFLLLGGPVLDAEEMNNGAPAGATIQDDEMTRATTNSIKGEIIAVEKDRLTVSDITTGREVTFRIAESLNNNDIHLGDHVRVTFSPGDASLAIGLSKE